MEQLPLCFQLSLYVPILDLPMDEGPASASEMGSSAWESFGVLRMRNKLELPRFNDSLTPLPFAEPDGAVPPRLVEPRSSPSSTERAAVTRWVGESALLPCVSEGFPVPESTWFRIESPSGSLRQVLPSPRVKYHLEVLVLRRLFVEDSGVYVCITNNTVGSQRIEVCLL